MSDPVTLIAEVLREHTWHQKRCCRDASDHKAHVAAVVAARLTEQRGASEESLLDLVDKWRELAMKPRAELPFMHPDPYIAFGQAMNRAAEDLADLVLDAAERTDRV